MSPLKKIIILVILSSGLLFLILKSQQPVNKLAIGDQIPSFELLDQHGKKVSVNNTFGKPMVIYFYPKDDTPGCVKEACKFRDDFELFTDLDVTVFGISSDSVVAHKKFRKKYNLPFSLLADTNNEVRQLFGVPKSFLFFPGRVTYTIDNQGVILDVFSSQFNVEKHIEHALKALNKK